MRKLALVLLCALAGCVQIPRESVSFSTDPQTALRGRVLVDGFAACGFCHGNPLDPKAPLSGGRYVGTDQGAVRTPNITPSGTGSGTWDVDELMQALRGIQSKDPEKLFFGSAHTGYRWMNNEDAYALLSYLRILDPIDKRVPRNRDENTSWIGTGAVSNPSSPGFVPSQKPISDYVTGRYLAMHVGRCMDCHVTIETEHAWYDFFSSDAEPKGKEIMFDNITKEAPIIRGKFSKAELLAFFDTGKTRKGLVDPKFCPTRYFKNAPSEQKEAVATYLALRK